MTRLEAKIVKRQLETYADYMALAAEMDRKAAEMGQVYESIAGAKTVRLEPKIGTCGHIKDHTERALEIFSDQMDAEKEAARARRRAACIENVIRSAEPEGRQILEAAMLNGCSYEVISRQFGYSIAGVYCKITRTIQAIPAEIAKANGML